MTAGWKVDSSTDGLDLHSPMMVDFGEPMAHTNVESTTRLMASVTKNYP